MNNRVLELLKNPKNIQSEDLHLLKEEINSFPYIQNIRALHLYGVHLYDQENYQKELSTTAAYTTDKKILYQLINGKIEKKVKPEIVENKNVAKEENVSRYFPKNNSFPIRRDELTEKTQVSQENIPADLQTPKEEIKTVFVNGERNRILFEGEENFLDEKDHDIIDIESTVESGTIVTQRSDAANPVQKEEVQQNELASKSEEAEIKTMSDSNTDLPTSSEGDVMEETVTEDPVSDQETQAISAERIISEDMQPTVFTPEEIVNEDKITTETDKEQVSDEAELSFHGTDSFMPDVKIQSNSTDELTKAEISQPEFNKHEEEMRRLIEEVEKKMKASKELPVEEEKTETETVSHDINFAETQEFNMDSGSVKEEDAKEQENNVPEVKEVAEDEVEEEVVNKEKEVPEVEPLVESAWKPMSFESHVPDSLIDKKSEKVLQPKEEPVKEEPSEDKNNQTIEEEISNVVEAQPEEVTNVEETQPAQQADQAKEKNEEAPVLNVSFFSSDISSWTTGNKKEENTEEKVPLEKPIENVAVDLADSNVPGFINTWQSWLKIDRTEPQPEKPKAEVKSKVIESFIENNPKISQLKEESSFVVKEKNDDISHLMTETLANLYFEQKLYTKAIKAYEILAGKHPEKKAYFEDKIQQVKDMRGKN